MFCTWDHEKQAAVWRRGRPSPEQARRSTFLLRLFTWRAATANERRASKAPRQLGWWAAPLFGSLLWLLRTRPGTAVARVRMAEEYVVQALAPNKITVRATSQGDRMHLEIAGDVMLRANV